MSDINELRHLDSDQLQVFNTEYINEENWNDIVTQINNCFPDGQFTVMDIGGGNGVFLDRIIEKYPLSNGILLDNSLELINVNKQHPRKQIIFDSIENLEKQLYSLNIDIVFINWVLHHLVSDTHEKTIHNIDKTLQTIHSHKRIKYIAIFENMYNGIWFDTLPSKIIFHLTSMKSIRGFIKKLGANTAGVGVSFLSKKMWISSFFHIFGKDNIQVTDYEYWPESMKNKLFLHIKNRYVSFFWIKN